jgi:hypothetical protein
MMDFPVEPEIAADTAAVRARQQRPIALAYFLWEEYPDVPWVCIPNKSLVPDEAAASGGHDSHSADERGAPPSHRVGCTIPTHRGRATSVDRAACHFSDQRSRLARMAVLPLSGT